MNIFLILYFSIVAVTAVIQPRIIKGKDAAERRFPYQVGIRFKNSTHNWWCSGALIDNSWVVTAAHCTKRSTLATLYLGSNIRCESKVHYNVSRDNFIEHKDYNENYARNDISLINIPAVIYDDDIQKIKLPAISDTYYLSYSDKNVIASGWGKTSDSSELSSTLQYASLKVMGISDCMRIFVPGFIRSGTLCAAAIEGSSICYGDSGGPLVLESDEILIGIASRGGCEKGTPSIFVRVTSYLKWIKEHTEISY